MFEPVNADVASILSWPSLYALEVAEHGRAGVPWVAMLPPIRLGEKSVSPGGIEQKAGFPLVDRSRFVTCLYPELPSAVALHRGNTHPFARVNAELPAVLEKHMVKLRSTNFESVRRAVSKRFTKVKGLMWSATVANGEIGTQLGYTDSFHTIQHAESLENGQIHGQQRLTDVKSRVAVFFEQSDVPATHFHQTSERRARRPASYNEHIEFIGDHCAVCQSFACQIQVTIYHNMEVLQANRNMGKTMQEQTARESKLAELIVKSLNLEDVEPKEIQPEEPLFGDGLGLDSIDALELALAISKTYSIQLKAEDDGVQEAFATLRSLDAYIASQGG